MAVVEPLGLEMIAGGLLGASMRSRLVDLLPGVDLEREVKRFSPDVCGISCSFTVDVPETSADRGDGQEPACPTPSSWWEVITPL